MLIEAVDALEGAGVGYLLTGSFASTLQGEPRSTHDIDFVIEVDTAVISALAAAFRAPQYYFDDVTALDALRSGSMFNLLDTSSGDKIDFWALADEDFDASRFARRLRLDVFGRSICVSAPEDTILQKLKWAVATGGSERQVRDAVGVYDMQRGALNESYLDEWAGRLDLLDLLAEVRARAASYDERVE